MKRPLLLPTLHLLPAYARLAALLITCVAMVALCAPHTSLSAACPPAEWHAYRTPSHDGLLVLPGSDIDRFCTGGDDGQTLYAIGTWNSPCANGTPEDPYAPDAMLFAPGQAPRLWKSTDGGETWDDRTEKVLTALHLGDAGPGEYDDFLVFTAIASAPDDAGIVLVAGYNTDGKTVMVASNDGAGEFVSIGCNEVDGVILCAAISPSTDGTRDFAVGTTNAIEGGKIWRYEVGTYWTTTWIDTSAYDGWDETKWWNGDPSRVFSVLDVAFSDDYENDRSVLATVIAHAEEPDGDPYHGFFMVAGTWNSSVTWNIEAGFAHYPVLVTTPFHTIHAPSTLPALLLRDLADIAVPDGFDADSVSHRTVLVAVNGRLVNPTSDSVVTDGGFLFWIEDASVSEDMLRLDGNPWVASVDCHSTQNKSGSILLGEWFPTTWTLDDIRNWYDTGSPALPCCSGVQVLLSIDIDPCCPHWDTGDRHPGGQFNAQVIWSGEGETAFASTSGEGRLWHDGKWYADESGFARASGPFLEWEETGLIDTMIHHIVDLAFDPSLATLYLHTSHSAEPARVCDCESVWRTASEGVQWNRQLLGRPNENDEDEDAFDDILGRYRRGFFKPVTEGYVSAAGMRYIIGDAIDPDVEEQVEAGLEADAVYRLAEGGDSSWKRLSELDLNYEGLLHMMCPDAPGPVLYAGFDNLWWDYTANRPLPYEADGSDPLYPVGHDCRKVSGVARVLAPDRLDCCLDREWDYLIRGLLGTIAPNGAYEQLSLAGANCAANSIRLWAIDKGNNYRADGGDEGESYDWCTGEFFDNTWGRLWKYDDCYATTSTAAIVGDTPLTVPSDPCRCAHEEFILEWERTCDACEYEIQIALDRQCRHVILTTSAFVLDDNSTSQSRFYRPPAPERPSLLVSKGALDCNETYWWRVRAHLAETDEVISSWWAEPQVFHTAPGPPGSLHLHAPGDGATGVPVTNVGFTWSAVSGASRYDFMLVDRDRGHVASQVWDNTYFVLPLTLEYDTPYIWRVIALDGERVVAESARSAFRTAPPPSPTDYRSTGPSIVPPVAPGPSNWGWYFAAIVGLMLVAAVVMLSYVNRVRRRSRRRRRNRPPEYLEV